ncbi:phage regulatory CII family protein [Tianweitania sediminis]|uniref:Uncharacterized protein n=1 Tax=Tianweitania sediminis TaxID=1502156 RepID=A0A8J7UKJ7_9HYPH|nr:phage regulatory CII family protein [Tianweitania sediminis]MBP0438442.1 hypothetical protein [Tianweitania sediminis]
MRDEAMKLPRNITDSEVLGLKADTRAAFDLMGGANKFALKTRVNAPQLSKWGSPADPAVIDLAVAVEADRELGAPMLIAAAAALLGYRLVPESDEPEGGALTESDARELRRHSSNLHRAIDDALEDEVVDVHERRQILAEVNEKIVVLKRMRRKVAG